MEVRCLLHQMDNRGILILGGEALTSESLSRILFLHEQTVSKLLSKWLSLGLLSRDTENGAYSSDEVVETERIRKLRSDVGKKGVESRLLKQNSSKDSSKRSSKPMDIEYGNGNDLSSSLEKGCGEKDFLTPEEIYAEYPLKVGKPDALRAIRGAMKKADPEFLMEKTRAFAKARNGDKSFCPNPATWFNQERYNDEESTWLPKKQTTTKPEQRELQEKIEVKML